MTSLFCRLFTVLVDINAVFFFQASEGKMSRNAYPKPCVTPKDGCKGDHSTPI